MEIKIEIKFAYKLGEIVSIGPYKGIVVGYNVREAEVLYQISYWNTNGENLAANFFACEINTSERFGFKRQ